MAKAKEDRRREAKREKEQQLAVCYVCSSGDYSEEDAIVFCERCCVAVHTSCYNAEGVSWLNIRHAEHMIQLLWCFSSSIVAGEIKLYCIISQRSTSIGVNQYLHNYFKYCVVDINSTSV